MTRAALLIVPALLAAFAWQAPAGDAVKPIALEKLNTDGDDTDPFAMADGLTLLYATKKDKDSTFDIYASKRSGPTAIFPAGKPLLADPKADERSPFRFKLTTYYASDTLPDEKLKDARNFDIFARADMLAPYRIFALSEAADEMYPWVTPAGKEFYFSRKTDKGWVLFMANGPVPGPIGEARPVGFPEGFHRATLSPTTLTMYLQGPTKEGRAGVYRSKRTKVGAAWSEPEPVTALNQSDGKRGDLAPCLSADGLRLYFASDRDGGKGGLDLYYTLTTQLK